MAKKEKLKRGLKIRQRPLLSHELRLRRKGFGIIAGIDEAGRGPLAGPVVAAAVILKKYSFFNRIDDSKKLTELSRNKAFTEIVRYCDIGIGIVGEKTIDRINILQATRLAMKMAVLDLPIEPEYILIDGNIRLELPFKYRSIPGGDAKSMSIAAASIIAKVTRDRLMCNYHKRFSKYGFKKHKGYGTAGHIRALLKYGPCPIHRKTFTPVKHLIESVTQRNEVKAKVSS